MEQEENYKKLLKSLKFSEPELGDKEAFTKNILREIRKETKKRSVLDQFDEFLFGWINSFRWRLTVAAASIFLVGFFIRQQLIVSKNLEEMESKLSTIVDKIDSPKEPGIMQKAVLKLILNKQNEDSIKLSREEFENFIKDYQRLMKENDMLRQDTDHLDLPAHKSPKKEEQRTTEL
jgi:hypothetical protein